MPVSRGDVLVEGLHCAPGTPFFRWLVTRLRDALGVRYAFVGEFTGDHATRLRVLATSEDADGTHGTPYEYDLAGSPVADPPGPDGLYWYPAGMREKYPDLHIEEALGIESFAGLRLVDAHGRPLGLLCVLGLAPFVAPDYVRTTLLGLRARATGDLELLRVQRERQQLTETAAAARERNALPRLVQQLARALDVRIAFVSELLDDPPTRARTLALWEHDRLAADLAYELAGTPCQLVYEQDFVFHPRDLGAVYPDDPFVAAHGAQAYMGTVLRDRDGRPIGHVGVLHDRPLHDGPATPPLFHVVALLATKELERLRTARASEGERELLAGGVAHDFNNLLAGIVAHSGLALDELAAPEAVRARLEAIQLTAQRAADLARGVLDGVATDRSGDDAVDLAALARETVTLLGPAIPPHVRVVFDDRPDLPCTRGSATHLRQIVMNLVLNAVEAIGEREGQVRVGLTSAGPAGALVLTVSDTGIGMNAATRARIFEPSFTTKARGRGIGLAVVRELVERHGAAIVCDSVPGAGSRFTVTLPHTMARRPTAPAAPPSAPPVDTRRMRALLVDDDEGVRVTTSHMLRRLGCDVVAACDGFEALATLERGTTEPNLVLLDMAMPGMSGEELVGALRRRWPALPIVVMSGYAAQDLTRRLGKKGALRFLQKPFGLDALRRCLRDLEPGPAGQAAVSA
jgi:signal transduction histidine kinase/ActR/RegA family two-component response regulator